MAADSSSDDEDSIPLSQLLRFPTNKTTTPTIRIPEKTPKNFNKNDIIWAKISPQTWSPAQITTIINKSTALVSLFDSNKTHLLNLSQICGFEENYAQIVKMDGAELSDEIDITLDELGRRAALGLMCSCRKIPNAEPVGSEFKPTEMLGFVRDMAVYSWVGADETVRAVKLSAQVNGYRHYASVCRTSGVDGGFCVGNLLGFLKNVAVSWGCDEWEDVVVDSEVGQIGAYRRFVSVHPDWMFRSSLQVEDGSDSEEYEESQQCISYTSSLGEIACGVAGELGGDVFSTEIPEDDCEIFQEQMQQGGVTCVTSKADFSIIDLDEEYESMMSNPLEPDDAGEYNCIYENLEMDDVHAESSSQESDIDVEMSCNISFSHVTVTNQIEANGTEVLENKESTGSQYHNANHTQESTVSLSGELSQSSLHAPFDRVSDITYENDKLKEVSITESVIPVPSVDCLLESRPCLREKFTTSPSSQCQAHPSDETSEFQSCVRNSVVNSHQGHQSGLLDIVSTSSQAEASDGPVVKKRRCEQSVSAVVEHDIINSSSVPVSSTDLNFPDFSPCLGGQLLRDFSSESQTFSPGTNLKYDVNCRSFTENASVFNGDDADQSETLKKNSCSISQTGAAEGSVARESRWDQITASNKSNLQNNMISHLSSANDKVLSHSDDVVTNLKYDVNCQSFTEDASVSNGDDAAQSETSKNNSCSISQTEAAEGSIAKKSRWDQCTASNKSDLQNNMMSHLSSASDKVLSHSDDVVASKVNDKALHKLHSSGKANISYRSKTSHSSTSPKSAPENTSHQNKRRHQDTAPDWCRLYASPLMRDGSKSPGKARKSSLNDRLGSFPKSLHMKFPRDFTLPSKEQLEKKFGMFGPLDHSRTKIFIYTGAAQVVFLRGGSTYAAHEYVKKRNVFGQANVRFWIDQHENYRKGTQVKPTLASSSLNLKSCLKRPERGKEKRKVRFLLENKPISVCTEVSS